MAARKHTITKFSLAFALACLLSIAPQPLLSQDTDQLYQQGVAAYNQGDFSTAESIFSQVTKADPNNTDAFIYLGIALRRQGKLEEAIASYEKAIELNPNYALAYYNLGNALSDQGKLEEAIASYEKAIELDPNYAVAYYNLGNALDEQGKLEEAIASYEKSIELNPNYAVAYNGLGIALRRQGKLEEAITSYEKAIELNPNYALPYNNLGSALYYQGKLEEAIASYEKAIELDPNYANAYGNLGVALYDQGKLEASEISHRKALEIGITQIEVAYNNLGYVLQQQGKLEEAIDLYQQSLEIDPESITVQINLREAERLLAIKLNPPLPDIDDTQFLPTVEEEPLVNTLRSTARIVAQVSGEGSSIGAGWVLKKEANKVWIVTNRHVVSDSKTKIPSKKIEVEFFSELPDKDRPRYPATIIHSTERNDDLDLAVLEVTGIPDDIQSLEMRFGRVRLDEDVRIIGHPYTVIDPWSVSSGGVINFNPNNPIMSIDANVAQGNSGGPVIDSNNQVIGMMVSLTTDSDIAINPNQPTPDFDVNQSATGGVGLAFRIDVVVEQLREWGILSEQ